MRNGVTIAALAFLSIPGSIRAAEGSGVEALFNQFVEAWNRHDARAFSLLFSPDADLTNWRGQHVRGRAAIEKRFHPMFSGLIFKDSICSGKCE